MMVEGLLWGNGWRLKLLTACSSMASLCFSPSVFSPDPLPTQLLSGKLPQILIQTLDGEVLPMPMNVPYKYTEGGGAIMVPANMVNDARLRLAAQGLPASDTIGYELLNDRDRKSVV